ncbi:MAG: hypothetical protein GTO14_15020 [Anaerolineales bacterium]|nr:hypothetical protein [Anaerolineales bacterium]
MIPSSIASLNQLPQDEKEAIYCRFIPAKLRERFGFESGFYDEQGRKLLKLQCEPGSTDVTLELRHMIGAEDPLLYAHFTDTITGQLHILLYMLNDPTSPRYDVDRMPDGTPTEFGLFHRNLDAELAALRAGLTPGQVRRGLGLLRHSIMTFEEFVISLGHDIYFVEPLHYHNAIVFERYGFNYQVGRKLMERIHEGFLSGGDYFLRLDGSSPFRMPGMDRSVRGRSWAIHDGVLIDPFTDVTMYKLVDRHAGVSTFPDSTW